MTNSALGGVEAPSYVTVESYRGSFYAAGWRSVDDPLFTGSADLSTPIPGEAELDERTGFTHRWDADGWAPFEEVVVTQDGAQDFAYTINGRRGRFTGSVGGTATTPGPGNHRAFMLHEGTRWTDSEITSLWWGPNFFSLANQTPTRRPQLGHVHRGKVDGDGKIRGIVAWSNIFLGPNPEVINLNLWESDGVTMTQGSGGTGGSLAAVERNALITHSRRIDAFDVAQHRVSPGYAASIPVGATASITEQTDTTFSDPAAVTILSGSRTGGTVTINTSTAHGLASGNWVLIDGTDNAYDGLYGPITVVDTDTFTYTQQAADDAAITGGTVVRRWIVNASSPGNALIGVTDTTANNNIDKTAGGFISPDYPWKVFPYWLSSRLVGNTLSLKQWAFGTDEPDWGDPLAAAVTVSVGTAIALPSGIGRCGVVAAHAHDSDYGEYGDIHFRRL